MRFALYSKEAEAERPQQRKNIDHKEGDYRGGDQQRPAPARGSRTNRQNQPLCARVPPAALARSLTRRLLSFTRPPAMKTESCGQKKRGSRPTARSDSRRSRAYFDAARLTQQFVLERGDRVESLLGALLAGDRLVELLLLLGQEREEFRNVPENRCGAALIPCSHDLPPASAGAVTRSRACIGVRGPPGCHRPAGDGRGRRAAGARGGRRPDPRSRLARWICFR